MGESPSLLGDEADPPVEEFSSLKSIKNDHMQVQKTAFDTIPLHKGLFGVDGKYTLRGRFGFDPSEMINPTMTKKSLLHDSISLPCASLPEEDVVSISTGRFEL